MRRTDTSIYNRSLENINLRSARCATVAISAISQSMQKAAALARVQRQAGFTDRATAFQADVKADATRFAEADVNADRELGFAEFLAMQPAAVRKSVGVSEIRSWFNSADVDVHWSRW